MLPELGPSPARRRGGRLRQTGRSPKGTDREQRLPKVSGLRPEAATLGRTPDYERQDAPSIGGLTAVRSLPTLHGATSASRGASGFSRPRLRYVASSYSAVHLPPLSEQLRPRYAAAHLASLSEQLRSRLSPGGGPEEGLASSASSPSLGEKDMSTSRLLPPLSRQDGHARPGRAPPGPGRGRGEREAEPQIGQRSRSPPAAQVLVSLASESGKSLALVDSPARRKGRAPVLPSLTKVRSPRSPTLQAVASPHLLGDCSSPSGASVRQSPSKATSNSTLASLKKASGRRAPQDNELVNGPMQSQISPSSSSVQSPAAAGAQGSDSTQPLLVMQGSPDSSGGSPVAEPTRSGTSLCDSAQQRSGGAGALCATARRHAAEENTEPVESPGGAARSARARSTLAASIAHAKDVIAAFRRHVADDSSFSEEEITRYHSAFNRFKVFGTADLHMDTVGELLSFLGHRFTEKQELYSLIKGITPYDYLDFNEFIQFMSSYLQYELAEYQKLFDTYDADGSGEIDMCELRILLLNLGCIPHQAKLREALEVVDQDNNGQLDFDELICMLAVFRTHEGFTKDESKELQRIFTIVSKISNCSGAICKLGPPGAAGLPATGLCDALVAFFGRHCKPTGQKLQEDFLRRNQQEAAKGSGASGSTPKAFICFHEFQIFGRQLREAEFEKLRQTLERHRTLSHLVRDTADPISERELQELVRSLGYTPLRQTIHEVFKEVSSEEWHENATWDFTHTFDFVTTLRKQEGFRKAALGQMREIFQRFEKHHTGEMDALELSACFRHLGWQATLDEIRSLVLEVDVNCNHTLDFWEFLRVIRLYREKELFGMRKVFERFAAKDRGSLLLPSDNLVGAIMALGYEQSVAEERDSSMVPVDFDSFVAVADSARAEAIRRNQKKAGFTDEELEQFKYLFDHFDRDGSGEIDSSELMEILRRFDWEPKTRREQSTLMAKLDAARSAARQAGVTDVGQDGSSCIRYWSFVQLARTLQCEHDQAEEDALAALGQQLDFSAREVDEFHQIYRQWCDKEGSTILSRPAVRRIVLSFGSHSLPPSAMRQLDEKLESLEKSSPGRGIDLAGFLHLMRWLVDVKGA